MGHALVEHGRTVLFTPTFKLVGRLLAARRDYELERELRRLDKYEVVILDDIGYVQQSREEMEVLFTFLAERYERRSLIITSNLVFSEIAICINKVSFINSYTRNVANVIEHTIIFTR